MSLMHSLLILNLRLVRVLYSGLAPQTFSYFLVNIALQLDKNGLWIKNYILGLTSQRLDEILENLSHIK